MHVIVRRASRRARRWGRCPPDREDDAVAGYRSLLFCSYLVTVPLVLPGIAALPIGAHVVIYGRRMQLRDALTVLSKDHRPPALYPRSFDDEDLPDPTFRSTVPERNAVDHIEFRAGRGPAKTPGPPAGRLDLLYSSREASPVRFASGDRTGRTCARPSAAAQARAGGAMASSGSLGRKGLFPSRRRTRSFYSCYSFLEQQQNR